PPGSVPRVVYVDPAGGLAAPDARGEPCALPGSPRPLEPSVETWPLQIHRGSATASRLSGGIRRSADTFAWGVRRLPGIYRLGGRPALPRLLWLPDGQEAG